MKTILAVVALSACVCAQNLVPNPGFEKGLAGYTVKGGSVEVVPFSKIGLYVRPFGLHDDSALRVPLQPQQKVTVAVSVPVPVGVTMARVGMWVGAAQRSPSNEVRVRVKPFGLSYKTGSIYMPILDSRIFDVSQWAGGSMPVEIEIEASPWYPHEIYLDDLAVEPVSQAQPWLIYAGSGGFNSLKPLNLSRPDAPRLIFLSVAPMASPWRVPGFVGEWWLEPSALLLLVATSTPLSQFGSYGVPSPLPDQIRFAAQLIEFDVANNALRLSNVIRSRTF
jgi:hypothetical protein